MTEFAIQLAGLRKIYPGKGGADDVVAVDGLDLEVRRGAVFGLLGPNGAGKTTTVEICEGLLEPTSGEVVVLGKRWAEDAEAIREVIGVSLQQAQLFEKQTVRELLELFASFYREPRTLQELLDMVQLGEKADARYTDLSGGQRQRLAVATALAGRPELVFLDEPTTGLDPQSRRALWDVIRRYRDTGGAVVLTTHYMEEAALLCDTVAIIDHGRKIAEGSPDALIASLGAAHVVEVDVPGLVADAVPGVFGDVTGVVGHEWAAERVTLTIEEPHRAVPAVLDRLNERGLVVEGLQTRHASLEDVFVQLTGRHLRDGDDA